MAYRLDRRVAVLEFDEQELHGTEVRCKVDVPMWILLDVQASLSNGEIQRGIDLFSERVLVGWTIEEDGEAIPANVEGMRELPISIALRIVGAWLKAAIELPLA